MQKLCAVHLTPYVVGSSAALYEGLQVGGVGNGHTVSGTVGQEERAQHRYTQHCLIACCEIGLVRRPCGHAKLYSLRIWPFLVLHARAHASITDPRDASQVRTC